MNSRLVQAPATGRELPDRERLLRPIPVPRLSSVGIITLLVALLVWGMTSTGANFPALVEGLPNIWDFITRLLPFQFVMVNWAVPVPGVDSVVRVPEPIPALVETIQMAIVGTVGAVLLSLPFGLLAARNITPHPIVYILTRFSLNVNRAVPDIIFALIFVAAVGLGPFAGILALTIGSIGTAAKMYAESIEAIDPAQVQAVRATGANGLQVFSFAVLPQALPLIASYSLLMFEGNVRSASILGIVGAGGIGLILNKYMALFKYQELMGALLMIVVLVTIIDRISDSIRRRIV